MSFYISHGVSNSDHQEGRDGLAFFYKPNKATLITLVQSLDDLRPTHRRDFYVDLKIKGSEPIYIRFAGTHLDSGIDLSIGNIQLSALVKDVLNIKTPYNIDLAVVFGDFNEGENENYRPRAEIMQEAGFYSDGSTLTTRPETLDVRHNGHVDWIYFKDFSDSTFKLIPENTIGDEKASDHKLISSKLRIWATPRLSAQLKFL